MVYENLRVVGVNKLLKDYKGKYIVCVKSNNFWSVYTETNIYTHALYTVHQLEELYGEECIIIKRGNRNV